MTEHVQPAASGGHSFPQQQQSDPREAIYYDALLRAFIDLRRERDRTLLALSTGGIGLLVTLLTAFGLESACARSLYFTAVFFFLVTIVLALAILGQDAKYVGELLRKEVATTPAALPAAAQGAEVLPAERSVAGVERRLRRLDRAAFGAFLVAMVAAAAFGFSQGTTTTGHRAATTTKEDESMSDKQSSGSSERSLADLAGFKPGSGAAQTPVAAPVSAPQGEGLSLEGVSAFKPGAAESAPPASADASPSAAPPAATAAPSLQPSVVQPTALPTTAEVSNGSGSAGSEAK